ncbi:MAG: hypothetical protein DDT26_01700 [Dehalococcoidia bacterium]|nr:hypothetical protein [Chloroflexota bacterium]
MTDSATTELKDKYIERYRRLHTGEEGFIQRGSPEQAIQTKSTPFELFSGIQFVRKFMDDMKNIVLREKSISLLDYGCGKGQHLWRTHDQFKHGVLGALGHGIREVRLYDPAVAAFSKPALNSNYQVVTCADVMEHVPAPAVQDVLEDIASKLCGESKHVYLLFSISRLPAFKSFADGENLHCTLRPMNWWADAISRAVLKPHTNADNPNRVVEVILYLTTESIVERRQWIVQK